LPLAPLEKGKRDVEPLIGNAASSPTEPSHPGGLSPKHKWVSCFQKSTVGFEGGHRLQLNRNFLSVGARRPMVNDLLVNQADARSLAFALTCGSFESRQDSPRSSAPLRSSEAAWDQTSPPSALALLMPSCCRSRRMSLSNSAIKARLLIGPTPLVLGLTPPSGVSSTLRRSIVR